MPGIRNEGSSRSCPAGSSWHPGEAQAAALLANSQSNCRRDDQIIVRSGKGSHCAVVAVGKAAALFEHSPRSESCGSVAQHLFERADGLRLCACVHRPSQLSGSAGTFRVLVKPRIVELVLQRVKDSVSVIITLDSDQRAVVALAEPGYAVAQFFTQKVNN